MLPGLFDDNQGSTTPVMSMLPLVGSLFANDTFARKDSELTVFITPAVIGF